MDTQFLSANRLTQQKWSPTFFEYMLANMMFSKFMGTGIESAIQIDKNLTKGPGDKITFRLIPRLTEQGGYDDSDIEGNEESLNPHNFPLSIHERSHGVRSAGKMTDKRTAINIRREATIALGLWAAEQLENDLIYALSGVGNQDTYPGEATSNIQTVNEKAPTTNRILYGGQTAAGVISTVATTSALSSTTDYLMGTKFINVMKRKAQLSQPKFRPIMINGKGYYLLILHPLQTKAIQEETGAVNSWSVIQANANRRGLMNPALGLKTGSGRDRMFDGIVGIWNDVILYESERILTRVAGEYFNDPATATNIVDSTIAAGTAKVARSIMLGAQGAVVGWGQAWKRYEKNFDYNRKPGTAIDGLYGVSKTQFADPGNNQNTNTAQDDFACLVGETVIIDD